MEIWFTDDNNCLQHIFVPFDFYDDSYRAIKHNYKKYVEIILFFNFEIHILISICVI